MSILRVCRIAAISAVVLAASGCATVTMTGEGEERLKSAPTYQQNHAFFLWGLVGEHEVDVAHLCGQGNTRQMQTETTFVDGLLGTVTFGIYSPRTSRVWCE